MSKYKIPLLYPFSKHLKKQGQYFIKVVIPFASACLKGRSPGDAVCCEHVIFIDWYLRMYT